MNKGVARATFFKWKIKLGRIDVSDTCKLKVREDQNGKLQRAQLFVEQTQRKERDAQFA